MDERSFIVAIRDVSESAIIQGKGPGRIEIAVPAEHVEVVRRITDELVPIFVEVLVREMTFGEEISHKGNVVVYDFPTN